MKKTISFILVIISIFTFSGSAFGWNNTHTKELNFNADGRFRIMMLNDFQDIETANKKSVRFLENVLDYVKPDLVVLVGDQLKDSYPNPTAEKLTKAIRNVCEPVNSRQIPFLFTFGNHDNDLTEVLSLSAQAEVYYSYNYCFADKNGCDEGTYNKVIYSSDGSKPVFNVYMTDTHSKDEWGSYTGVNSQQVQWYKEKSDELKVLNYGMILPSILFQHVPCKEIHKLLINVPEGTPGAVNLIFVKGSKDYWIADRSKMISDEVLLGEAPSTEPFNKITGQYEAWLEKGDIVFGAYFGHDHVNDFVGVTEDGITLGYNGGFGYASYGPDDDRCVKVFEFDENDLENFTITRIKNSDLPSSKGLRGFIEKIREFFERITDWFKGLFK